MFLLLRTFENIVYRLGLALRFLKLGFDVKLRKVVAQIFDLDRDKTANKNLESMLAFEGKSDPSI